MADRNCLVSAALTRIVALIAGLCLPPSLPHAQVPPSTAQAAAYAGLHAAAQRGNAATIKELAAKQPEALAAIDGNGRTALHVATFVRHRAAIIALLGAGAKSGALDNDRYDAVTIAAVPMTRKTCASCWPMAPAPNW